MPANSGICVDAGFPGIENALPEHIKVKLNYFPLIIFLIIFLYFILFLFLLLLLLFFN